MSARLPRKKSAIAGAFIAHPRQLLESPSMRVLSLAERRALDRIELEHMAHGGAENGRLPVTYVDFKKWGVRPDSIAGAIRALEALGLIEITRHGYAGVAEKRAPSLYRLTYVGAWNAGRADATGTHEYQQIKSVDEAEHIAGTTRKASDPRNVLRGKTTKATPQIEGISPHKSGSEMKNLRPTKRGLHTSPPNCGVLSISRAWRGTEQAAREARPSRRRSE